jgi:hypothetical protein
MPSRGAERASADPDPTPGPPKTGSASSGGRFADGSAEQKQRVELQGIGMEDIA